MLAEIIYYRKTLN